ncbi:hypothetical protein N7462_008686 [Penicillium macrosclerotiorum]|uniref:uncharacterized protein n=1 Tax=Penicillium macrosclerotiorum TaxID=303699 RepID=UPI0025474EA6|nr:uncharacterized protein N7462_008686 [Penicillium macrosclerotiorum]KAJ5675789.1 hypothetical protein N7462_008686 [Penicillium macrosclerotiorum]
MEFIFLLVILEGKPTAPLGCFGMSRPYRERVFVDGRAAQPDKWARFRVALQIADDEQAPGAPSVEHEPRAPADLPDRQRPDWASGIFLERIDMVVPRVVQGDTAHLIVQARLPLWWRERERERGKKDGVGKINWILSLSTRLFIVVLYWFLRLQHPPRFQTSPSTFSLPSWPDAIDAQPISSIFPPIALFLTSRPKPPLPSFGLSGWIIFGPDKGKAETNLVSLRHTRLPGERETPHTPWNFALTNSLFVVAPPLSAAPSPKYLLFRCFGSSTHRGWRKSFCLHGGIDALDQRACRRFKPHHRPPAAIASPEPISFLKPPSKPESNLSSIASAGLHVSRSQPSPMASPTSAPDRPAEQDGDADRNRSQVAREALGASEKSPGPAIHEPAIHEPAIHEPAVHASPEQMQVDTHTNDTTSDPYGSSDHHQHSLMHTSTVASPGPIEESASQDGDRPRPRAGSEIEQDSNKAFSYPMPTGGINDPRRGLSLPNSGYNRGSPRSPSAKKHRCPYCATEFTRQHNLKSHLLTHSQEKPFVCQTCQSRFRRLHDLKRHTKLHTGERPHICPKCGRRFARGDALARHNKGQGGCAGRRASMGSFAPEDDYPDGQHPDDTMDGLVYAEPERMDEEDERRLNMPSIRKHDADPLPRSDSLHVRQPSTYPPIAANRGLFPPPGTHGGSSTSSVATSQPGNLTFPPAAKVRSPSRPMPCRTMMRVSRRIAHTPQEWASPCHTRKPRIVGAANRQHMGPPGLGLPPPQPGAPQLPPPVISSPDARFSLQATAKHTPSHSHSSSHGLPPPPKLASDGPDLSETDKLWAYVRSMHDELTGLRTEVAALRAHIASTNASIVPPPIEANQANSGPR